MLIEGRIVLLAALVGLVSAEPLAAQEAKGSAAVFALLDRNEWCPGGSVYVDLDSGAYMLHARPERRNCSDPDAKRPVEQGKLGKSELQGLRSAYARALGAGLRREPCEVVISNGGPEALVVTGSGVSAATPEDEGCWSKEAIDLHAELFRLFGRERRLGK
jgi:hypothetical protein